jgi:hypothetical protein
MMLCFVAGNSTQSMSLWQKHVTVAEAEQRHKELLDDRSSGDAEAALGGV